MNVGLTLRYHPWLSSAMRKLRLATAITDSWATISIVTSPVYMNFTDETCNDLIYVVRLDTRDNAQQRWLTLHCSFGPAESAVRLGCSISRSFFVLLGCTVCKDSMQPFTAALRCQLVTIIILLKTGEAGLQGSYY